MRKQKIRLVHPERLCAVLSIAMYVICLVVLINAPKSPIERWHEACENGTSWQEYIRSL